VPVGTVVWQEVIPKESTKPAWEDDVNESKIDFSKWGTSRPVAYDGPEEDEEEVVKEAPVKIPNLGSRPRGIHQAGGYREHAPDRLKTKNTYRSRHHYEYDCQTRLVLVKGGVKLS